MAKQVTGNYFYMDKNGGIVQDSHPGRDKKTGYPKSPYGVKDAKCWTELKQSYDLWFYPDGTTKSGGKKSENMIPIEENDRLVMTLTSSTYERLLLFCVGHIPDVPFWRYAIEQEWKQSWQEEWAERVSCDKSEWWRAEIKAFLSVVKDLSNKGIIIGDITKETVIIIKERFSKNQEVS